MVAFTTDRYGRPGMPTFNVRKVRRLLKSGRAEIVRYEPFTIRLLYAESLGTQPVEICVDAGDRHIGISVKSEKHEYVHAQYDPLPDEKQRHEDRARYRRMRRGRLRHRKPRFDNICLLAKAKTSRKHEGWLAPTVGHKKDLHVSIVKMYAGVCPISSVTVETASFDTQALEAIQAGRPLPQGTDYQQGPRYRLNTLRDAVFYRDGHKCQLCGKSTAEGKILRVHHLGFWKKDHSDRMSNLITLCTDCHTQKNHKPGGRLYGWKPKIRPMTGAAFMNAVRFRICGELEAEGFAVTRTYGSATKTARQILCIEKTHANDAYSMGQFHPKHRQCEQVYRKRRRNSRTLEKFYDAKYIDLRNGKKKSGQQLSCGRTNRSESRRTEKNERVYRGRKVSKGRRSIRRQRYSIRPGTILKAGGVRTTAKGVHCNGTRVILADGRSVSVNKVTVVRFPSSWERIS